MQTELRSIDWDRALPGLEVHVAEPSRGPIEIARAGNGRAVLLIHGTPGSWRQAIGLADDICDEFTVLLPSRPGYGATPLSTGLTAEEQADVYAETLDELGINDVAIVGISGGAPSAAEFAVRHRDRTWALVLACPVAKHLMPLRRSWIVQLAIPGLAETAFYLGRLRAKRKIGDPTAVEDEARKSFTPDEFERFSSDEEVRFEYLRFLRSHLDAPVGLDGMRNDILQTRRSSLAADLADVACPVLVLHGESDSTVGLDQAQFYADAMRAAVLETYEEAGHLFLITRRESGPRIRSFLQAAIAAGRKT
jgi:pimeloyl-ACP methyl ester carboxylesterase